MHVKFGAARFHGFGVMEETDGRTDGLTHNAIYYYQRLALYHIILSVSVCTLKTLVGMT